ncbi:MAG: hypothetical protein CFE45_32495 [Burkholderiales bacterium PBB5]|nr:MAG: hypothetical protein CFE45_32495 [Burkholderiales bacterium PBB5]
MAALLWLLASCSQPLPRPAPPAPVTTGTPGVASANTAPAAAAPAPLATPAKARNWDEFHRLAALRLVAANRSATYDGPVPEPLLAIPVLEVELKADGSVQRINVKRKPTQALDTVQLAIDAVKRAAPFGPVGHLPRPWVYTEVFLFDDNRHFKPRTLDD